MQVYCTITAKSGQRVSLTLEDTALTPTQLREKVSEATKIPLKDLRLIFRGRMIKDDDSISSVTAEYKLEEDSVLHCMGKPVEDSNTASATSPVAAPAVPDTTTVPNRTVVPPLSTTTAAPSAAGSMPRMAPTAPADPLTKALARLKQNNPLSVYSTAVGTLEKILTNIANNPMEEKYRRVKKNNAAFGKRLGKLVGGHDCMLATGFVVEHQSGEEVYQLHASAEKWNALLQAKAAVSQALAGAKVEQEQARRPPMAGFGAAPSNPMAAGMGGGGFAPPNMNDPNMQNMMSQMMSNPEALQQALQNPMVQEMMRNDPNVSPMMRQYMETMANNPAMLQQLSQRMQDPAVRAQLQRAMQQQGGMPGMGGMPSGASQQPASSQQPARPPPPQNDHGQTEEEMIAEAIRRSLQDN